MYTHMIYQTTLLVGAQMFFELLVVGNGRMLSSIQNKLHHYTRNTRARTAEAVLL